MNAPVYTVRTLLTGLIDYAGLFPPAQLDMKPAVEEFARQRLGAESWMLGRFVVPLSRLDEFEHAARVLLPKTGASPWRLSALAGASPSTDRDRIDRFNTEYHNRAIIDAVEIKASNPEDVDRLAPSFQGLEAYFEIPWDLDPHPFLPALRRVSGRGKIRTGGVTPDLIPPANLVARFIHTLGHEQIPFKATAGLHHPLRGEYPLTYDEGSELGTMFGFLNVFLAATFAQQGILDQDTLEELLNERALEAFRFDDDQVAWREHKVDVAALALARKLAATSYGSCSFAEPVEDLRALQLM